MKYKMPLGFLRVGEYFVYDNKVYRVGRLIKNTNGYVACVDENKKVRRFYIDDIVEKAGGIDEKSL